ncbi:MAG: hypothetical protein JW857_06140 [Bacteroidales bacterium]|nr:hypothetical protein [Bacteroidales bacterium]
MVKFALFIVRLFKRLIQLWGVDYPQFETLLQNKLTLDFRRNPSSFKSSGKQNQTFLKQLMVFSFLGVFVGMSLFTIHDLLLNLTIIYSVIMVMLATTLINEFTSVLFDERDNDILLARPISHRTLLLVRLVHIQFYMGYIALALSLFAGIVVAIQFGIPISLAYFLGVGLCAWITLLFTIFFYLALSKFVKGEKFKDFITYVQIFLAIIIFGAYQLLPRIIDMDEVNQASMSIHWWTYLIPPTWLAAFVNIFSFQGIQTDMMLLSVLAVVVPFAGAIVIVRFLSKGFGNILGQDTTEESTQIEKKSGREKLSVLMNRLFCATEMESMGWKLAMKTTQRDRKFKQSVYPMFGFIPVFALMMLKPDFKNLMGSIHKLGETNHYLFFVFIGYFGTISIMQLQFTDNPEASWIYKALPFTKHGHLLSGAVKAMLYKFFVPIYLILTLFTILIWDVQIFPKMLLGGLLTMLEALVIVIIQKTELPFTQAREMQQKGASVLKMILGMFLIGIIVGLVYLSSFIANWIILLISVFIIGIIMLTYRAIRAKKYTIS